MKSQYNPSYLGTLENTFHRSSSQISLDRNSHISYNSGTSSIFPRSKDEDGFELPADQKRKLRRNEMKRRQFITGKSSPKSEHFKGAPEPNRDLFIYRVDSSTSETQISSHIVDHGFTVRNIACVSNPNAKFKSFRLTVPLSEFKDLFDEKIWPCGVRVRKYIPPRVDHN